MEAIRWASLSRTPSVVIRAPLVQHYIWRGRIDSCVVGEEGRQQKLPRKMTADGSEGVPTQHMRCLQGHTVAKAWRVFTSTARTQTRQEVGSGL
jgi:hypothetical protein